MTDNYTVVIPTLWKYSPFISFLEDLVECDRINEIILFDNASNRRPVSDVFHSDKLQVYEYGYNLGVNRPWNLGVEWAKNKKILIVNDDVIFDFKIFNKVDKFLSTSSGVIGICPGIKDFNQPPFESGATKIIPWSGQHTYGFGCLMFVHKDWFVPIPDGLTIYYGDNWIFDTCLIRGRTNYIITDALFHTPFATSTKELNNINELHRTEQPIYNSAIAKFRSTYQLKNF